MDGMKGDFNRICVLFKPYIYRKVQGGFIIRPFTKYKNFHSSSKIHLSSNWYSKSMSGVKDFIDIIGK